MSSSSEPTRDALPRPPERWRELRFPGASDQREGPPLEAPPAGDSRCDAAPADACGASGTAADAAAAPSARARLRFSKTGDLRWISHRDLARTIERLFRRAGVGVRQSEGFHPKPRMTFPSALALGVIGADEVLDVDLATPRGCDELLAALNQHSVEGLTFHAAEALAPGQSNQAAAQAFELLIPRECSAEVAEAARRLSASSQHWIERPERREPHDIRPFVDRVEVLGDVLYFRLRVTNDAGARPRDVLAAVGLDDWQARGLTLTRTTIDMQT